MEIINLFLILPFVVLMFFALISASLKKKDPKAYEDLIRSANKSDNEN